MYTYSATVLSVHDSDTVTLNVDLGFDTWHRGAFRIHGINARELAEPGGKEARDHLAVLLAGAKVVVDTVKPDKFGGRWGAHVKLADGRDLGALLVGEFWAASWDGRGAKPVPPWPRP